MNTLDLHMYSVHCTLHVQQKHLSVLFENQCEDSRKNVVKGLCWEAVGGPEMVCENKSWNSGLS